MWTKNAGDKYEHKHRCELDGEGTGVTVHTSLGPPHTHDVINYEIQEYKGHTHEMQDGSADIRGYENSGEDKDVELERDDNPVKRLAEAMSKKSDEEIEKLAKDCIKVEVSVSVPQDKQEKGE